MVAENIHQAVKDVKLQLENLAKKTMSDLEITKDESERSYLKGKLNFCVIAKDIMEKAGL